MTVNPKLNDRFFMTDSTVGKVVNRNRANFLVEIGDDLIDFYYETGSPINLKCKIKIDRLITQDLDPEYFL